MEEIKAGVKGEYSETRMPKFFVHPPEKFPKASSSSPSPSPKTSGIDQHQVPVIDLQGMDERGDGARRTEIIYEIRKASETWGLFQMVNHGVPVSVMDAMLDGTRRFHEQPQEAKMGFFSSDLGRKVRFDTCCESNSSHWKDSLSCTFQDDKLDPEELPLVCRKEVEDYAHCMIKLRKTLSELLSEALGPIRDYLSRIEYMKSHYEMCLHYPACFDPNLAFATPEQSEPIFLIVLLQDSNGGLQVLHQNQWLDVPPVPEADCKSWSEP